MNWLTFISKIIQVLAWPVSVVVVIDLLRKQIIEQLRSASGKLKLTIT